ncbi:MAG: hypothetical protein ABI720_00705 [Actinomycetes bacterium]
MSPAVHLHIGEPKTGTTYIQAMLFHHREKLLQDGLLVPGRNLDHIRAGHDVLGRARTAGTHSTEGAWEGLATEIVGYQGSHAVVSMEMLTRARPRQVERAVAAFGAQSDVRVVITARELSRLAPARWQESVQFRKSWRLDDYLSGVFGGGRDPKASDASRHFWGLHDTPATVRRWSDVLGMDRVCVVTLPAKAASPDELWVRFGEAINLDLTGYEPVEQSNASLGAASAELMRRVNEALAKTDLGDADHARICRKFLGKTVLPVRKGSEPSIAMPAEFMAASRTHSEEIVAELKDIGVGVIGSLNDLLPPDEPATDAKPLDEGLVAAAAVDAMAALIEQNAQLLRSNRRKGKDLPFAEVE